jgi:serine-type D-Ala-D-Ala carboxypeptidase/endopeptidase (penicillin-binding protein 4)
MFRLLFLCLLYSFSIFPQTDYSVVQQNIEELLKDPFFTSSGISISVYDLTEDQVVYELETEKLLRPASNMKILTSAAALLFLDEYSFRTSLHYTGSIVNETLYGDLYIRGGCDPDFTSRDLDSLVSVLADNDIDEISGGIYIDTSMKDSLFWGNGWMWDDDPSTDAPYLSALNIDDNAIRVLVNPGKLNSPAEVSTEPATNFVSVINQTTTTRENLPALYITREWMNRTNNIIVQGKVDPYDTEYTERVNIFGPENYFMHLFFEKLADRRIKSEGIFKQEKVPSRAYNLFTYERPLDSVIVNLNKISDNLSAEMVLYALAEKYYGSPARAKDGLRMVDSMITLAGRNSVDYVLADGSGVSHYNLISTGLVNDILKYFYKNHPVLYEKLYNSFPEAGIDGTLRTRMRKTAAEKNVHAKTGTLSGVSSLSGYLNTRKGNLVSFSIFIQNFRNPAASARIFQDRICDILAGTYLK